MPSRLWRNKEWRDRIAWVILIGIVFFSVIRTQAINDDLKDAVASQMISQTCTEEFLGSTVEALNERTKHTTDQAEANIDLQRAQLKFIRVLVAPGPTPDAQGDQALNEYFNALTEYNRLTSLSAGKADDFPYPTREDYRTCLKGGES